MKSKEEILNGLAHCTGSMTRTRWSILFPQVLTEGAKYLAESAGAYWLMDAIASHQPKAMRDPMLRDIQFWTLKAKESSAVLTCERDLGDVVITQKFNTIFPLDEVKLYVQNGVILLPSEY
ncbi:MAG: DUF6876 family protein [Desulfobulbia bacterium]